MTTFKKVTYALSALFLILGTVFSQNLPTTKIPAGAKVYIAPIADGFDGDLKKAFEKKKVPLVLVDRKEDAQYVLTGAAETQKASTAKKVILWDWHSNEQASIQMADVASGTVVFGYSVNKVSSAHGKQSTAEACAKHLKDSIEKK